jgi:hypothetical protein
VLNELCCPSIDSPVINQTKWLLNFILHLQKPPLSSSHLLTRGPEHPPLRVGRSDSMPGLYFRLLDPVSMTRDSIPHCSSQPLVTLHIKGGFLLLRTATLSQDCSDFLSHNQRYGRPVYITFSILIWKLVSRQFDCGSFFVVESSPSVANSTAQ